MPGETVTPDWTDLRRRHANCLRADGGVSPWAEFEAAALDMIAAHAECRAAHDVANAHLDRLVPPSERYCAWHCYAPAPVVAIYDLFRDMPNSPGDSDFRFRTAYGKSHRAPLAWMAKRTEEFRAATRRVRRILTKHLAAAEAALVAAAGEGSTRAE